mmetsp:Transcript_70754/g.223517  ORF Transcript_70754/g.223517 Transcript_70754/m.223517 type:complete len:660 (+) Transcript_70754:342-2321(+)
MRCEDAVGPQAPGGGRHVPPPGAGQERDGQPAGIPRAPQGRGAREVARLPAGVRGHGQGAVRAGAPVPELADEDEALCGDHLRHRAERTDGLLPGGRVRRRGGQGPDDRRHHIPPLLHDEVPRGRRLHDLCRGALQQHRLGRSGLEVHSRVRARQHVGTAEAGAEGEPAAGEAHHPAAAADSHERHRLRRDPRRPLAPAEGVLLQDLRGALRAGPQQVHQDPGGVVQRPCQGAAQGPAGALLGLQLQPGRPGSRAGGGGRQAPRRHLGGAHLRAAEDAGHEFLRAAGEGLAHRPLVQERGGRRQAQPCTPAGGCRQGRGAERVGRQQHLHDPFGRRQRGGAPVHEGRHGEHVQRLPPVPAHAAELWRARRRTRPQARDGAAHDLQPHPGRLLREEEGLRLRQARPRLQLSGADPGAAQGAGQGDVPRRVWLGRSGGSRLDDRPPLRPHHPLDDSDGVCPRPRGVPPLRREKGHPPVHLRQRQRAGEGDLVLARVLRRGEAEAHPGPGLGRGAGADGQGVRGGAPRQREDQDPRRQGARHHPGPPPRPAPQQGRQLRRQRRRGRGPRGQEAPYDLCCLADVHHEGRRYPGRVAKGGRHEEPGDGVFAGPAGRSALAGQECLRRWCCRCRQRRRCSRRRRRRRRRGGATRAALQARLRLRP